MFVFTGNTRSRDINNIKKPKSTNAIFLNPEGVLFRSFTILLFISTIKIIIHLNPNKNKHFLIFIMIYPLFIPIYKRFLLVLVTFYYWELIRCQVFNIVL